MLVVVTMDLLSSEEAAADRQKFLGDSATLSSNRFRGEIETRITLKERKGSVPCSEVDE